MHHHHEVLRQIKEQQLPAPADRTDLLPDEAGDWRLKRLEHGHAWDKHLLDGPPLDSGPEVLYEDRDKRQLRHYTAARVRRNSAASFSARESASGRVMRR